MTNKQFPFYIDLVFCVFLLPLLMVLLPIERLMAENFTFSSVLILWLYFVYFSNRHIVVPVFFKRKKYIIYVVLLLICITVVTYFISESVPMNAPSRARDLGNIKKLGTSRLARLSAPPLGVLKMNMQQQAVWFLYVVVLMFSTAVGFLTELFNQISARKDIEFEKKKAELALYKAQINPHFLFNTLNTLYGFLISRSEKAEQAFMQFINIVRYMYTNGAEDKISVESEVQYIQQYIELQSYRLNKMTKVDCSFTNDNELYNAKIAPMLLISFVENAFKYGVSSLQNSEICVDMSLTKGVFVMNVSNTIVSNVKSDEKSGIGLENSKQRLKLLYPNNHKLDFDVKNDVYSVCLTVNLN